MGAVATAVGALFTGGGLAAAVYQLREGRKEASKRFEQDRRDSERSRASFEREQVMTLAKLHGALEQTNVVLSPLERGSMLTALSALPADSLPLVRSWLSGRSTNGHQVEWSRVRDELQDELRRLTVLASG